MFSLYIKCCCNHENLSITSLITSASSRPEFAVTPKTVIIRRYLQIIRIHFLKTKQRKIFFTFWISTNKDTKHIMEIKEEEMERGSEKVQKMTDWRI